MAKFFINLVLLIKKNYRFLTSFIIFLYIVSICELYIESSIVYIPNLLRDSIFARTILFLSILVLIFLLPNFLRDYQRKLGVQKINKQHSWFEYFHFSVSLSPIISLIIFYIKIFPNFWKEKIVVSVIGGDTLITLIIRIVFLILGIVWYCMSKPIKQTDEFKRWRFAPYSINTENDRFGWKEAAEREAKNILLIDKYVSVVVVDGNQGGGKSSYSRMIIDALIKKSKLLYTYISLTETNQEKDFSKMFLERCFTTINERYPKINFSNSLPIIREGLRDNGYGIWSVFLDMLTRVNQGISETKSIVHDPYSKSNDYVDKEVAEKFGNVQMINEDLWIILIDEIDRAPAKEIYRAIETIERYKYDGRCGLPVKIVFLLCVDRLTLYKNLKEIRHV